MVSFLQQLFEIGAGPFVMHMPVDCSWNATYESLLGSTKTFAQPIPLGEMVDFLVDGWEQEGLYD